MRVIDMINEINNRLDKIEEHIYTKVNDVEPIYKVGQILTLKDGRASFMLAQVDYDKVAAICIVDHTDCPDVGNRYNDPVEVGNAYNITFQELKEIIHIEEFDV